MPFYESVFIARQDISSTQAEALADSFANILAENGGTVAKREYWGLKNMAYRIKKNRKGHYVLFNIDAPPAAIREMERNMGISEDVLRYITVSVEALEEGPSAMMVTRQRDREGGRGRDRDDRPRREREPAAPETGEKPAGGGT